jgi:hypothetical protein
LCGAATAFELPLGYSGDPLDRRVNEIAKKCGSDDIIIIGKKEHLLYYCRNGEIVRGERFGCFVINFPVPVALGAQNHWTPEGKFKINVKNPKSKYTLFLGFSGKYGIHGPETGIASKLDYLEFFNPDLKYVTIKDNTRGCVAVENRIINYLFARVGVNTPVFILRDLI